MAVGGNFPLAAMKQLALDIMEANRVGVLEARSKERGSRYEEEREDRREPIQVRSYRPTRSHQRPLTRLSVFSPGEETGGPWSPADCLVITCSEDKTAQPVCFRRPLQVSANHLVVRPQI